MDKIKNTQTILITGATGNVGKSLTRRLASSGYRLIGTTSRNPSDTSSDLDLREVNLLDAQQVENFSKDLQTQFGNIDAIVLLAGGFKSGSFDQTTSEDIRQMIDINFLTAFHVLHAFLPGMRAHGFGRVILTGAAIAERTYEARHAFAYVISKRMVLHLAELIQETYGRDGIQISVLLPGTIGDAGPTHDSISAMELSEAIELLLSDRTKKWKMPVIRM